MYCETWRPVEGSPGGLKGWVVEGLMGGLSLVVPEELNLGFPGTPVEVLACPEPEIATKLNFTWKLNRIY